MSAPNASTLDVSRLPTHAFGHRSPLWWGVVLLIAIEGTMMGLLLVSDFYLRGNFQLWPPSGMGPSVFRIAVTQALLLAASLVPNALAARAARREALGATRLQLVLVTLLAAVMLGLRFLEYAWLPFRWDENAYTSIFWMILVTHTLHVYTGIAENLVLLAVLIKGPVERKHFGDVEASCLLWYFVVLEWVACFAILYVAPIFLPR